MGQPFVGEIRMFGGSFAPAGWAFCAGQTMAISENETLFQLLGTTYGGDGQDTFGLPNLCGRVPIHQGTGPSGGIYVVGQNAGTEQVTLTTQQIPNHTHTMLGSQDIATGNAPANNVMASTSGATILAYGTLNPINPISSSSISPAGGSQPHENMQPFLVVSFIISLFGIFPTQS